MRWVVVDANIVFRALVSGRADLRSRLTTPESIRLVAPKFLFVELFKHKDRLTRAMRRTEEQVLDILYGLICSVELPDEGAIPVGTWLEARRLCAGVDPKDTPYVALALHLDAELWTDDNVLKASLMSNGFTSFFAP